MISRGGKNYAAYIEQDINIAVLQDFEYTYRKQVLKCYSFGAKLIARTP